MLIEASTKWGRVKMEFPDEMTPEDRAAIFVEMAKIERGPKIHNPPWTGRKKVDISKTGAG